MISKPVHLTAQTCKVRGSHHCAITPSSNCPLNVLSFLGSTAYVLSLDGATYQLWNASTGECYDMHDVRCPLQSIGCLIDETNVSC